MTTHLDRRKLGIVREHFGRYLEKKREKRANGGHHKLEDLFVYVTSRCNATCDHCFYWQELNREEDEIQIAEFERLAESVPPFEFLIMTGGETFLRRDLEEIVGAFAERKKCNLFQFNTNGFTPKMIAKRVRSMLERFPNAIFQTMCSLDGFGETHNKIRNNPRAWELTNETLALLTPMMAEFPGRLYVGVLTVICQLNWEQIEPLAYHVRQKFGVIHAFELIRGTDFSVWHLGDDARENYNPPGMELPPREKWDDIWRTLNRLNHESGYLNRFFHIMTKWQFQMLREGADFKATPCVAAGRTSATIYSNGDVAACEFSKPFANIRDFDCDFDALWHSESADARRAQLTKCHCTHACYLTKNLEYSLRGQWSLLKDL